MQRYSNPIFYKNYCYYLGKLQDTDLAQTANILGCREKYGILHIPFLGKEYQLNREGICDSKGTRPIYPICVVLLKYVLLCPQEIQGPPPGQKRPGQKTREEKWLAFRNFKDAAPFAAAFSSNVEFSLVKKFSTDSKALANSCQALQGEETPADNYDLCYKFQALPRISTLLLFNFADEEFPANCSLLFSAGADHFLDMESLAITGWLLADYLRLAAGEQKMTIM